MAVSNSMQTRTFGATLPALVSPLPLLRRLGVLIADMHRRSKERALLRGMDYATRQDLGLSRVAEEMHKPSWKA